MVDVVARVHKHRVKLRDEGMRPIQLWVLDTRREGFAEECQRQSALLANDSHEDEMMLFLSEVADTEGWTA